MDLLGYIGGLIALPRICFDMILPIIILIFIC